MILRSIAKGAAFSVSSTGAVAGTTAVNGASIDMLAAPGPFDSVLGIALLGALTATQVTYLKAQGSDTNNGSDWADLGSTKVGPAADADGNKILALDLYRPQHRYIRFVLVRGTANAVLISLVALQYNGQREPISQAAAQVSAQTITPYADYGTP